MSRSNSARGLFKSFIQYELAFPLAAHAIEIAADPEKGSTSFENLFGKYRRIVDARFLLLP